MISLIYTVTPDDADAEKSWLKEMKVYPAVQNHFDWIKNEWVVRFGVIVSSDAALSIKLRHPLQFQKEFKRR